MPEEQQNNHPAYQHILDVIPESLHAIVVPELKKWDAGVTQKFQEIHQSYEGLKPFKEIVDNNIDPEYVKQAIMLADSLQRKPAETMARINETFKTGFLTPEQAEALQKQASQSPSGNEGDDEDYLNLDDDDTKADLLKNPQIKAMYDKVMELDKKEKEQQEQAELEQEFEEFQSYLDTLEAKCKEQNLPFNRLFVSALVSEGIDGEEAVKEYHKVLAGDNASQTAEQGETQTSSETPQPPPVMGSDGNTGSGQESQAIKFGTLSKDQVNQTVMQLIEQANQSGQS